MGTSSQKYVYTFLTVLWHACKFSKFWKCWSANPLHYRAISVLFISRRNFIICPLLHQQSYLTWYIALSCNFSLIGKELALTVLSWVLDSSVAMKKKVLRQQVALHLALLVTFCYRIKNWIRLKTFTAFLWSGKILCRFCQSQVGKIL